MPRLFASLLLALVPASLTWAAPCDTFPERDWLTALDAVDASYQQLELRRAQQLLRWTEQQLPCLDQLVHPADLGRFAQQMSFQATLEQDAELASTWAVLANITAPELPVPEWLPPDHAAQEILRDPPDIVWTTLDGSTVAHPKKGGVFLNGLWISEPRAPVSVMGLLQKAGSRGQITHGWWQHGASFPAEVLGPPSPQALAPPDWYEPPGSRSARSAPNTPGGIDPSARTWRLRVAAGLGGATAGLYATSWIARSAYDRSASNALYYTVDGALLASAAAGTAAVGFLTAALLTRPSPRKMGSHTPRFPGYGVPVVTEANP